MDAVTSTRRLKESVIVRIFAVGLKDVVIHILGGQLNLDRINSQRLEFQHGHGSGGVLKQCLIYLDGDLFAWNQTSINKMVL